MTVRPARAGEGAAIARVRVETWRSAYAGIVPEAHLQSLDAAQDAPRFERRVRCAEAEGTPCLVAEREGAVVGFAVGGAARDGDLGYERELWALYVLPAAQGTGQGAALFRAFARACEAQGARSMFLWVLTQNARARAFYERMGGVPAGHKELVLGGALLGEVAYGYRW